MKRFGLVQAVAATVLLQAAASITPTEVWSQVVAIRGGTVYPISGPPIEGGTVLIRDGRIAEVGVGVSVPGDATVVDAAGLHVIPGIVDAMSYYGIAGTDLNETTAPSNPHLRALEAYYPFGAFGDGEPPGPLRSTDLLMGGVTTHYVAPADATVIGGQGAVVKAAAPTFEGLLVRDPAAIDMTIGQRPAGLAGGHRPAVIGQRLSASGYREDMTNLSSYH